MAEDGENPGMTPPPSGHTDEHEHHSSFEPDNSDDDQFGDHANHKHRNIVTLDDSDDDQDRDSNLSEAENGQQEERVIIDLLHLNDLDDDELKDRVYQDRASDLPKGEIEQQDLRNAPLEAGDEELKDVKYTNCVVKIGSTVELVNGEFLRVKAIIRTEHSKQVTLRGWILRRCNKLKGMLPKKLNELCYIFDEDKDDPRSIIDQSTYDVNLYNVKAKRLLIRTNRIRPHDNWPDAQMSHESREEAIKRIETSERLFVRWKYIRVWENSRARMNSVKQPNKYVVSKTEGLSQEDCTSGQADTADSLRYDWRGETVLGGAGNTKERFNCPHCEQKCPRGEDMFEHYQGTHQDNGRDIDREVRSRSSLTHPKIGELVRRDGQTYLYGDTCKSVSCVCCFLC